MDAGDRFLDRRKSDDAINELEDNWIRRFSLDSTLDVAALRTAFQAKSRLLVPRILSIPDAELLSEYLMNGISWGLTFRNSEEQREHIGPKEALYAGAAKMREALDIAFANGDLPRAHLFGATEVSESGSISTRSDSLLGQFEYFLNSDGFLEFLRELTGVESIRGVDAVATRYEKMNFYSYHFDRREDVDLRGAFVFNLTRFWIPQWGGLLEFRDRNVDQIDTFFPRFNSMSVFLESQEHGVSIVAPFAVGARYAISGQFFA